MAFDRGFDSPTARSRRLLSEAADALLEPEGQHAISARRGAAHAGLKAQLVHYYFRTMDDLLVAVFHHAAEQYLELHEAALAAPQPWRALWRLNSNMPRTRRNIAFMALAAQHQQLRAEMLRRGELFRTMQIDAVDRVFKQRQVDPAPLTPAALAMLMAAIARTTAMEAEIGVTLANEELHRLVELFVDGLEPHGAGAPVADPLGITPAFQRPLNVATRESRS